MWEQKLPVILQIHQAESDFGEYLYQLPALLMKPEHLSASIGFESIGSNILLSRYRVKSDY